MSGSSRTRYTPPPVALELFPVYMAGELLDSYNHKVLRRTLNYSSDYNLGAIACGMSIHTPLRRWCVGVTDSNWFRWFIAVCILVNSAFIALEPPTVNSASFERVTYASDIFFFCVFLAEMILKIFAMGLHGHKRSYLSSPWNVLDGSLVLLGAVAYIAGGQASIATAFRCVRVLRPLRTMRRVQELSTIVNTLLNSVPLLAGTFFLLGCCLFIFAIVGMHLCSEAFHQRCGVEGRGVIENTTRSCMMDGDVLDFLRSSECADVTSIVNSTCMTTAAALRFPFLNFDSIGHALLLAYRVASFDGWLETYKTVARAYSPATFLYFLALSVAGGYVCYTLIIAILVANYAVEDRESSRAATLKKAGQRTRVGSTVITPSIFLGSMFLQQATVVAIDGWTTRGHSVLTATQRWRQSHRSVVVRFSHGSDNHDNRNVDVSDLSHTVSIEGGTASPPVSPRRPLPAPPGSPMMRFREASKDVGVVVASPLFLNFMLLMTILNAVFLSYDHYGISSTGESVIRIANIIFASYFILECIVRAIVLGPRVYVRDPYNTMDSILSLISIPELAVSGGSRFTALRLLRTLRLGRMWPSFQHVLSSIAMCLPAVGLIASLLVIMVYIFAIVGFDAFRDSSSDSDSRLGFASFPDGLLTVFVLITGEDWSRVMENVMSKTSSALPAFYFVVLHLVGSLTLLNVFIAVVVQKFRSHSAKVRRMNNKESNIEEPDGAVVVARRRSVGYHYSTSDPTAHITAQSNNNTKNDDDDIGESARVLLELSGRDDRVLRGFDGDLTRIRTSEDIHLEVTARISQLNDMLARERECQDVRRQMRALWKLANLKTGPDAAPPMTNLHFAGFTSRVGGRDWLSEQRKRQVGYDSIHRKMWRGVQYQSCGIWHAADPVRRRAIAVVQSKAFKSTIIVLILLSALLLVLDTPRLRSRWSFLGPALLVSDIVVAVAFLLEAILRIIAVGLCRHPGAYLRSPWNVLDAAVVIVSFLALAFEQFKFARVLRVLRLLAQSSALKMIIASLVQSGSGMATVTLVGLLLWWIFGIVGVSLFKGSFYECTDASIALKEGCVGDYNATLSGAFGPYVSVEPRRWVSRGPNFDNIGEAMLTLLQIAVKDGWYETMYNAVDSQGTDMGPRRNARPFMSLYFVVFLVAGGFFLVNLFVGVLVDRFTDMKARGEGSAFMTTAQKKWVLAQKVVFRTSLVPNIDPAPPESCVRYYAQRLALHRHFEAFFTGCILANGVVLSLKYYGESDGYSATVTWLSTLLLVLFTIEAVLKIVALSPGRYWMDHWNKFDAVVVVVSWIGVALGGSGTSIVRMFRVVRLLMLVKRARGLRTLISTLVQALPAFMNTMILLFATYFVFGVIGVTLFSGKRTPPLGGLLNFDNVWSALLTLYVAGTTESWMGIMQATEHPARHVYFVSFMIIGSFIMLNLLVTVITESFAEADVVMEHQTELAHFGVLQERWVEADPKCSERLHAQACLSMIRRLPEPMWYSVAVSVLFTGSSPFVFCLRQLCRLHIPINRDGYVRYHDVVAAMALAVFGIRVADGIDASQKTSEGVTWDATTFSLHHYYAASYMCRWWRRHSQSRATRRLARELALARQEARVVELSEIAPLRQSQREAVRLARYLLGELVQPAVTSPQRIGDGGNSALHRRVILPEPNNNNNNHNNHEDGVEEGEVIIITPDPRRRPPTEAMTTLRILKKVPGLLDEGHGFYHSRNAVGHESDTDEGEEGVDEVFVTQTLSDNNENNNNNPTTATDSVVDVVVSNNTTTTTTTARTHQDVDVQQAVSPGGWGSRSSSAVQVVSVDFDSLPDLDGNDGDGVDVAHIAIEPLDYFDSDDDDDTVTTTRTVVQARVDSILWGSHGNNNNSDHRNVVGRSTMTFNAPTIASEPNFRVFAAIPESWQQQQEEQEQQHHHRVYRPLPMSFD
eukprot:PhM_4_TR17385/c3_g1_i2/m.32886